MDYQRQLPVSLLLLLLLKWGSDMHPLCTACVLAPEMCVNELLRSLYLVEYILQKNLPG